MIKMFRSFNIFGWGKQNSARSAVNEMPVKLRMPGGSRGETVPAARLVSRLSCYHYDLALRQPEVSQWLERYAPDVKYAIAANTFADGDDHNSAEFRVGSDGTIQVYISLEVDDR